MAQRTVALCNGKYIGIESIYTVIGGRQINIPEKLKELRMKSQRNQLFCPCGCGANLVLVAGDKNLREQHFRVKDGVSHQECHVITEGRVSVHSKIVLKCWLDEKLAAKDLETRVPIHAVEDSSRMYEFTFLSRERKIALSYSHERINLSDEKLSILESNSSGIRIIYVVDAKNGGANGQYPEALMKVQNRQEYCLLLSIEGTDYDRAELEAVFYDRNIDGLWQENSFAFGLLRDFQISQEGRVIYSGQTLDSMLVTAKAEFAARVERERDERKEQERIREESLRQAQEERERQQAAFADEQKRLTEAAAQYRLEREEARRKEEELRRAEEREWEEDFIRNMEADFAQQETQIRDAEGNRWIKCEYCGKKAKEKEFASYGGLRHINLGTCKECSSNNPEVKKKLQIRLQ